MTQTRVTELQSVLLTTAAKRDDGSLLPVTTVLAGESAQVRKALTQLLKRGLIAETEQPRAGAVWRSEDERSIGLAITAQGRTAIGIVDEEASEGLGALPKSDDAAASAPVIDLVPPPAAQQKRSAVKRQRSEPLTRPGAVDQPTTKTAAVIALLSRKEGATIAELVHATGWLPHTTRAALTGLRKKGHVLAKSQRDQATCYTLAAGA